MPFGHAAVKLTGMRGLQCTATRRRPWSGRPTSIQGCLCSSLGTAWAVRGPCCKLCPMRSPGHQPWTVCNGCAVREQAARGAGDLLPGRASAGVSICTSACPCARAPALSAAALLLCGWLRCSAHSSAAGLGPASAHMLSSSAAISAVQLQRLDAAFMAQVLWAPCWQPCCREQALPRAWALCPASPSAPRLCCHGSWQTRATPSAPAWSWGAPASQPVTSKNRLLSATCC